MLGPSAVFNSVCTAIASNKVGQGEPQSGEMLPLPWKEKAWREGCRAPEEPRESAGGVHRAACLQGRGCLFVSLLQKCYLPAQNQSSLRSRNGEGHCCSLLWQPHASSRPSARGSSLITCSVACPSAPPQGAGLLLSGRCLCSLPAARWARFGEVLLHLLCEQPFLISEGKTCPMDRGWIWPMGWICAVVGLWGNGPLVQRPGDTHVLVHRKESVGALQISRTVS